MRCESLIPDAYPRPFLSGLNVDLSGLEPDPKMDSFELNKILGAILGTCLVLLVTSFTASALFAPAGLSLLMTIFREGRDVSGALDGPAGDHRRDSQSLERLV